MRPKFISLDQIYLAPPETDDINNGYIQGINDQQFDLFTEHAIYPHDHTSLKNYIEAQENSSSSLWLGIFTQDKQEYIGNIQLAKINLLNRCAEYSILLWSHHGKGYAYAASNAIIEHGFSRLNLNRIELGVNATNLAAIKLYKKLGFVKEGVKREFIIRNNITYDIEIYSLLRREFLTQSKD